VKLFNKTPSLGILTVCTANICRSPMAEGLIREELKLRNLEDKVRVESAGTHVARRGQSADKRAIRVCAREGIDLRRARTRQVVHEDFNRFTYILAMDQKNLDWLRAQAPVSCRNRISLIGSWAAGGVVGEIPDPYFGSPSGFEDVLARLHQCVDGFLAGFSEGESFSGD
jgi:protein-tyrosine phosphatase